MTRILNRSKDTILASDAKEACSLWARTIGLMGRRSLAAGDGLIFSGTKGVHTHFMRFPIDLIFYAADGRVVDVVHALRPWRFSRYYSRAGGVVELPAGTAKATQTAAGDQLSFEPA